MVEPNRMSFAGLTQRVFDSAVLIAIVGAAASFAGWTCRLAYFQTFGLDPSSVEVSTVALGSDGLVAIVTVFWTWLKIILPLAGLASLIMIVATKARKRLPRKTWPALIDRTASLFGRAMSWSGALLVLFAAGTVAGKEKAQDLTKAMRQGSVLTYHLKDSILCGLPIVQGEERIWLLTRQGLRTLKAEDIRLIDGPFYMKTGIIDASRSKANEPCTS